ncbi:hypothetical protein [Haloterrigena sp. H1]|uniref:hypothetical protein n=1 Tax=Haloterrigena sp. H1 TaxID=2552943 RepID=UPI00201765EA|nr:hypothetical protein [Haloterrigena sp. H1]
MEAPVFEKTIYRRPVRGKLAKDPMKRELVIDEGVPVAVDAARSNESLVVTKIGARIMTLEVVKDTRFTQKSMLVVLKSVTER